MGSDAQAPPSAEPQRCDLVLGGGGVRGIAHVGALAELREHGYTVNRIAGASSGAMAGSMIAAGASPDELKTILTELDWPGLTLSDLAGRLANTPLVGGVLERVGQNRTTDPDQWITRLLADRGVHTWADLRLEDPDPWIPQDQRYRLVVRALDIVNRRIVRLPWDYQRYGLDPDEQPVAQAVRASMSVPLVFDPVPIGDRTTTGGLLIDGGLGAGFSVDVLDRRDGESPDHPTFALRLLDRPHERTWPDSATARLRAVVATVLDTGNQMKPTGPCDERRTINLDTSHVRTLDVLITKEEVAELFDVGADATRAFLAHYDHRSFAHDCRGGHPSR
ncbi:patatin-like phospholipase family protein [Euzebya tangerina]|uniref:patatin-like phospholipase family protein n=1 Tax=Euzebya tangerina TaxID=591198 RepID=UPI0013C349D2|nr:patatin-like phospholipase family protein [Euzebya tangerina]